MVIFIRVLPLSGPIPATSPIPRGGSRPPPPPSKARSQPPRGQFFPTCDIAEDADGEVVGGIWGRKIWSCFRGEDWDGS